MSREEFDIKFKDVLDAMVEEMAGDPNVEVNRFYGLVCYVENLAFFSPLFFDLLKTDSPKE